MEGKGYKIVILLYIFQLVLLAILVNDNLMQRYDFFQPASAELVEFFLGIIVLLLNVGAIFIIRSLYQAGLAAEQDKINALKFKNIAEQNQIYRQHRHDMLNHLKVISELASKKQLTELKQYLSRYRETIDKSMITVETGLKELDILIYTKYNQARERRIDINFYCFTVVNCDDSYIIDLISIVGNVLDNAIEACEEIERTEHKIINIKLVADPFDYILVVANSFDQSQKLFAEDLFREDHSTKGIGRGKGLSIIKRLVDKYSGKVNISIEKGLFIIRIELPKHELEG